MDISYTSQKEMETLIKPERAKIMKDYGYGIFEYNGKSYAAKESATYTDWYEKGFSDFFTDVDSGHCEAYRAVAVDEEGNEVYLLWKIANPNAEMEEDMCDWNEITAIEGIY